MKVPLAFMSVILIWSTTPLGIAWSNALSDPILAVFIRMLIATMVATAVLVILRLKLPLNKNAMRLYAFSSIGVLLGMSFSYLAALHISSGIISLMFGLSPIISGMLASNILKEKIFTPIKLFSVLLALLGLVIILYDNLNLSVDSTLTEGRFLWVGLGWILLAVFCFCLSSVLVKTVDIKINPFCTTIGSLYFTLPFFFISWLFFGNPLHEAIWTLKAVTAIVYLGIFGSLVGFIAYFYILQKLSPTTVTMTMLVTPAFAITLGIMLNNEPFSSSLLGGSTLILFALSLYHWGEIWVSRLTHETR